MFKIYNPSAISGVDNKSFYRQLDVWRALAAIWVVMDHACSTVVNDTSVIKDSKLFVTKPYIAFSLSGQLGVIMFFVISGYCIVFAADNCIKKNKTYKEFLRARLWRIFPPYYASIALGVALTLCFLISSKIGLIPLPNHSQNIFHNSLTYYLVNLTLTQEIFSVEPIQAIYWSLCYEVAFYFIIAVSILLHIKAKVNFYDLIFGLTHLSLLWLIFSPETCPFPVNLWYLFGLGAMVHMMIAQPTNVRIKWLFAFTCTLILVYAYVRTGIHTTGHPSTGEQAIFGVIFSLLILFMYRYDEILMGNRVAKVLALLGAVSYSIYLSHPVIIAITRQLLIKLGIINEQYWISFIVQILVGIAFGCIFHIFCEKPFMSAKAKTTV